MSGSDASVAERLAERPAVDVASDLTVAVDGHEFQVESYTDRITVDAPGFRGLFAAASGLPVAATTALDAARTLAAADLTVVLRIGGVEVARLGADRSGVSYGHVSVRPGGLLRAAVG